MQRPPLTYRDAPSVAAIDRASDDKSVFIRADAAASVQDLATVMDKLKEAGVEKVGWMTKPAGQ